MKYNAVAVYGLDGTFYGYGIHEAGALQISRPFKSARVFLNSSASDEAYRFGLTIVVPAS